MDNNSNRWFLHVDLDAFFASVEQLDHPEYRGKPVIVGGKPEDRRGVVSTASYEARKFGVHSAMPTKTAYKLCPQGIFLHGRMERYHELSFHIMNIFKQYSPDVDQMSIDEAFIDLTGTEKLFGKPEDTAMKIKAQVKEETGLTVSIGLAQTKYIAKIASGYSKPDGFHFVKPGTETDFMLNLPLSKVWGVGSKTLEQLNKNGIRTTKNLYDTDLQLLEFNFGEKTANFLYNAVRGKEAESFSRQRKSHSISAERTFEYDIYDLYTAETYLLELCQNVSFRLLKEESFSKTVTLKLRYNDFTTVNIQETYESSVLTIDAYYEAIIKLFEKKYETGRGIRLLGVGFDNVEKEIVHQYTLFDDNDEKKQVLEKAILNLESKHPEIKIHKARLLTKTIKGLLLAACLFLAGNKSLSAQSNQNSNSDSENHENTDNLFVPKSKSNPEILFDWDINDKNNVDFLVSGYWLMSLEYSAAATFGNNNGLVFSSNIPIFKQEMDIYTWLLLNNHYYFEADFADEFKKNTIALGYTGNGTLSSARLSNRNITIPSDYSAAAFGVGLGGGNNEAPGISMHFNDSINNKWAGDFLIRYDMTKLCDATFFGHNKLNQEYISLTDYVRGQNFILPEGSISYLDEIKAIYVQDENGDFEDSNNHKFKKLSQTQYINFRQTGRILIANSANSNLQDGKLPIIAVTFNDNSIVPAILSDTGNYSDENSFAGKIQKYFNTQKSIDLEKFSYSLSTEISNSADSLTSDSALVLQNSYGFSPFLIANIYDIGETNNADFYVVSKNTDFINTDYSAAITTDLTSTYEDFFATKHQYVSLEKNNLTDSDEQDSDSLTSLQNPCTRYPLGAENPEIYLNLISDSDLALLVRSYSSASEFNIGTSAADDSVCVYINGIQDTLAKYNNESGTVTLSKSINETDKIYITWYEDSKDFSNGSLATGIGFMYNFLPELKSDFALTVKWPVNFQQKYMTVTNPQMGFAAFSSGIAYSKEFENSHLNAGNKSSVSLKTTNPTGVLMVSTQGSNSDETYYHSKNDGFTTKVSPVLNLETETIYLDSDLNGTVKNHKGINDSNITGYKIPLEYDFSVLENEENNLCWAAVDISLDNTGILKSASEIEFSFLPGFDDEDISNSDLDVYLQLGIAASEKFTGENLTEIPTWKINDSENSLYSDVENPLDISKNEWQTVTIQIDDFTRTKLFSNQDARLIVVNKNASFQKGTIFAGPYEPHSKSLFVYADEEISLINHLVLSDSKSSKELFHEKNYANEIKWQIDSPELITDEEKSNITTLSFFKESDFSSYSEINFDFAVNIKEKESSNFDSSNISQLTLILDRNGKNVFENGDVAVQLSLFNINSFYDSNYHSITINPSNHKVSVDGEELSEDDYELTINSSIIPDRLKTIFNTNQNNQLITKGEFYISNLYYTGSKPSFNLQNQSTFDYKKTGEILKIGDYTAIENGVFELKSNQNLAVSQNNSSDSKINKEITATTSGEITITNINYKANIDAAVSDSKATLNQAGHSIKTEKNLFKVLDFSENYNYFQNQDILNKSDTIKINFSQLHFPLVLSGEFDGKQSGNLQQQTANLNSDFSIKTKKYEGKISGYVNGTQKISSSSSDNSEFIDINNYFVNWLYISQLQFSAGNKSAQNRQLDYKFIFNNKFTSINFAPALEYDLSSQKQNRGSSFTDTSKLILKMPVTLKRNSFYFNISRTGIGLQELKSDNYFQDSKALFETCNSRAWFYTAIPFYELFQKDLNQTLVTSVEKNQSQYEIYNTKYETGWKRKIYNNISDLFIPSSSSLILSREIKAADSASDLYQFKTVITNTALNLFGSTGFLPIFKWYKQEEIISSLTGIVKFPTDQPSNTTYSVDCYNQIILFIKDSSTLKNIFDFDISTDLNWNLKNQTVWSRKAKSSLLEPLVGLFVKDTSDFNYKITRKDSFNLEFGIKDKINTQKYEYSHTVEMNFRKFYTLSSSMGTSFNHIQNKGDSLNMNLSIGGKMEF